MEKNFFSFVNLSRYEDVVCGISTRIYGDMGFGKSPAVQIAKNRKGFLNELGINLKDVVSCRQNHGSKIAHITSKERGLGSSDPANAIPDTDGLITDEKGIYLCVTVADCLPILIYDPVSRQVGAIHAGWRGIAAKIASRAVERLASYGADAQNLIVGIGPGICQRHFVVKKDVLELFLDACPKATFLRNNDGYIDLKRAVVLDLEKAGVLKRNIEVSNYCPVCDSALFGSFRKEGENVSLSMAVIGLKGD